MQIMFSPFLLQCNSGHGRKVFVERYLVKPLDLKRAGKSGKAERPLNAAAVVAAICYGCDVGVVDLPKCLSGPP